MPAAAKPTLSFEFFPPKTPEGRVKLRDTWQKLAVHKPAFFSVTFGAGGSTREGTLDTVLEIRKAGLEAAPHISGIASSKEEIAAQLERYRSHGIRHLVALRGDLPGVRVLLVAGPKDHGPGQHDYPAWQKAWLQLLPAAEEDAQ